MKRFAGALATLALVAGSLLVASPAQAAANGGCTRLAPYWDTNNRRQLWMSACISISGGTIYSDSYTEFNNSGLVGGWTSCTITLHMESGWGYKDEVPRDCRNAANSSISGSRIFTGPIVRSPADYRYHMFYVVAGTRNGTVYSWASQFSPWLYP
ncbi:hypothetical protein [Amycolatopsis sp.]|uniref:hypothetical protein n=1 Tax=Amycolatopsis sp. TaxID=37632 RepID=UPI002D810CD9|nr:hypothetical protein [Amycolatopsis sp.]HET6704269.1 hypothetical protein [Amycolatopsis sp.]